MSKYIKLLTCQVIEADLQDISKKLDILYKFLLFKFPTYFNSRRSSTSIVKSGHVQIDNNIVTDTLYRLKQGQSIRVNFDLDAHFKDTIERWYCIERETPEFYIVNKFVGTSPTILQYYLSVYQRLLDEGAEMDPLYLNQVPDKLYSDNLPNVDELTNNDQTQSYFVKAINIIEKASGGLMLISKNPSTYKALLNNIKLNFSYVLICYGKLEKSDELEEELSDYQINWTNLHHVKTTQPPPNQHITKLTLDTSNILNTIDIKSKFFHLGFSIIGNGKYTVPLKNSKDRGMMLSCIGLSFLPPGADQVIDIHLSVLPKFDSLIHREERFFKEREVKTLDQLVKVGKGIHEIDENYPIPYQTGIQSFYNLSFIVNPKVLIPRPSTETLVTSCIKYLNQFNNNHEEDVQLLDLGTGSGCILLSTLYHCKQAHGIGLDISEDTLSVAKMNADKFNLSNRAKFQPFDMLKGNWSKVDSVDIILCNPPYLPKNKISHAAYSNLKYEPKQALFCYEDDQTELIFYEKLSQLNQSNFRERKKNDEDGRMLIIEVGKGLDQRVEQLFKNQWNLLERVYDGQGSMRCLVYQLK